MEGLFASHQAVRLVVRRIRKPIDAHSTNNGDSVPSSPSPSRDHLVYPVPRNRPVQLLLENASQPGTPNLKPVTSLTSSIASLDPLSRSFSPSPAIHAITERLSVTNVVSSALGQELRTVAEDQLSQDSDADWEEVEVGKGLAQYNSVEIDRIKGMKR